MGTEWAPESPRFCWSEKSHGCLRLLNIFFARIFFRPHIAPQSISYLHRGVNRLCPPHIWLFRPYMLTGFNRVHILLLGSGDSKHVQPVGICQHLEEISFVLLQNVPGSRRTVSKNESRLNVEAKDTDHWYERTLLVACSPLLMSFGERTETRWPRNLKADKLSRASTDAILSFP